MIGAGCPVLAPSRNRCRLRVPRSFASASVTFLRAARFFISAAIVTAASVTAVPVAARKPSASNAARPTVVTNRIPTDAPITATANASTGAASKPA
jgi:hypothetical protein